MKPATAHVKGTDIVAIRNMLQKKSRSSYEACLTQLSAEDQGIFKTAMATDWISNATATAIMENAAKTLFPGSKDDLEQLGRACAEHAFSGIYKAFLRISSVSFLLKNVPLVWNRYHSVGTAVLKFTNEKSGATLVVTGAPEVSISNLKLISGFSVRALEMAGAKNLRCNLRTDNPDAWHWVFTWQA